MSQKHLSSKTHLPLEKITKYYIPDISMAICMCMEAAGLWVRGLFSILTLAFPREGKGEDLFS